MRPAVVSTIVGKDLREFRTDRFFLLITGLSLVFYPLIFWLLPSTVDETLRVGVVQRGLDPVVAAVSEGSDGLEVVELSDRPRSRRPCWTAMQTWSRDWCSPTSWSRTRPPGSRPR